MVPTETREEAVLGKIDLMKRGGPSVAVQGGLGASFRGFLSRYVDLCERGELIWVPSEQRVHWAHKQNVWDRWEHLFT